MILWNLYNKTLYIYNCIEFDEFYFWVLVLIYFKTDRIELIRKGFHERFYILNVRLTEFILFIVLLTIFLPQHLKNFWQMKIGSSELVSFTSLIREGEWLKTYFVNDEMRSTACRDFNPLFSRTQLLCRSSFREE